MQFVKHLFWSYGFAASMLFIALIFAFGGVRRNSVLQKQILFSFSAIFIAVLAYEVISFFNHKGPETIISGTYTSTAGYFGSNELLGYAPHKQDFSVTSRMVNARDSTVIYDVRYTLKNGIRYTPTRSDRTDAYTVFLGCSFTFGEGLNDDETLPFLFNQEVGFKYNTLNYGFHGYGTHQVLAIAENILVTDTDVVSSKGSLVVYSFLYDHIRRAAGYSKWDVNGPRYEIEADRVVFKGSFQNSRNFLVAKLSRFWKTSYLYKNVLDPTKGGVIERDLKRTLLMINRIKTSLERNGLDFLIILDQTSCDSPFFSEMKDYFLKNGINFYTIPDIIPDYKEHRELYEIRFDDHPSKLYNEKVAKYLAERITQDGKWERRY
jgi:hypothetical protein